MLQLVLSFNICPFQVPVAENMSNMGLIVVLLVVVVVIAIPAMLFLTKKICNRHCIGAPLVANGKVEPAPGNTPTLAKLDVSGGKKRDETLPFY